VLQGGQEKTLTDKEKLRCSVSKDPTTSLSQTCVCFDADYAKEMAYLKEKVRRSEERGARTDGCSEATAAYHPPPQ